MKFVEQHIHGAFGINFMNCEADDVIKVGKGLFSAGIEEFYPTLMTGKFSQFKAQIKKIKEAASRNEAKCAKIGGIHLEGPFIDAEKKGIHQREYIVKPTVEAYREIEDDFIKIVTLAPEFDDGLIDYLHEKGVKVSAGHCLATDLSKCDCATHLFNAMGGINHKIGGTALSALLDDNLYVEVLADGNHVCDDVLRLIFQLKPADKVILISDALPCVHVKSDFCEFAGTKVFEKNGSFYDANGTLAGSAMLLPDIAERLASKGLMSDENIQKAVYDNPKKYLCGKTA